MSSKSNLVDQLINEAGGLDGFQSRGHEPATYYKRMSFGSLLAEYFDENELMLELLKNSKLVELWNTCPQIQTGYKSHPRHNRDTDQS